MNPPVNRSSESPRPKQPKKTTPPESSPTEPSQTSTPEPFVHDQTQEIPPDETPPAVKAAKSPEPPPVRPTQVLSEPTDAPVEVKSSLPKPSKPIKLKLPDETILPRTSDSETTEIDRNQPIPPPSHPRQYRAIGLVYGQYQRVEDQLTKGNIVTQDGTAIDAVVLGRVISLVKNHLDLEQPHLWVVYPRTRQEDDHLHVQIVGVWEPETLNKEKSDSEEAQTEEVPATPANPAPGYFSIRGEVIFASQEEETVIIKIRQSPKKDEERPKFFKLKLKGILPSNRPFKRFWDLQVQLQGASLLIQQGQDLGFASKRKPFDKRGGGRFEQRRPYRNESGDTPSRPFRAEARPEGSSTPSKRPLPSKPIKGDQTPQQPE